MNFPIGLAKAWTSGNPVPLCAAPDHPVARPVTDLSLGLHSLGSSRGPGKIGNPDLLVRSFRSKNPKWFSCRLRAGSALKSFLNCGRDVRRQGMRDRQLYGICSLPELTKRQKYGSCIKNCAQAFSLKAIFPLVETTYAKICNRNRY